MARQGEVSSTTTNGNTPASRLPLKRPSEKLQVITTATSYSGTAKPKPSIAKPIPVTATDPPKAAPKKGSYAEILARAKVAQTSSAHVGVIKHKPKETLSKKERLALQAEALGKSKIKGKEGAVNGHVNTADSKAGSTIAAATSGTNRENGSMKPKKAPDVGYKGTARALPEPAYKGTINRSTTASSNARKKDADDRTYDRSRSTSVTRPIHRSRHADYSDEDDDVVEDEEEADYESDLSDMEAGAFDVEEEELLSSKVARREDEEELRREIEAKKQKDALRKKLTQMAAAKRRR